MAQTETAFEPIPDSLESPRSKLVYLYLTGRESATIERIQTDLKMKKIALYAVLQTLTEKGLIERTGSETYRHC